MIRTTTFVALVITFVSMQTLAAQVIEAPWQPVNPTMSPVAKEPNRVQPQANLQGGMSTVASTAPVNPYAGPQVSTSNKPVDTSGWNQLPGNSPYYTSTATYAPTLAAPNYGYGAQNSWNGSAWGQPYTTNSTSAWWNGDSWVQNAPGQAMPAPGKFPAIISNAPVANAIPYPNNATQPVVQQPAAANMYAPGYNVTVTSQPTSLPAAPATGVARPGAPLQSAASPTTNPAAFNPSVAVQTQVQRPAAPFVDETVFAVGGQAWREYDITPYTSRYLPEDRPEHAVRRWLLAQTGGPGSWFGHETAALKISRDRVQVYQTPEVQARVADVLGRFLYYVPGRFRCRARVFNLAHVKTWRSEFQPRLIPAGTRSPGRQAWLIDPVDANRFVNKFDGSGGGYLLGDQRFVIGNGQDATITVPLASKSYVRDVAVESGYQGGQYAGTSYRPKTEEIEDGVRLRLSPLIAADAATIELDVQASSSKVEKTKEVTLDAAGHPKVEVPDVATAMLDERVEIRPGKFVLLSLGLGPNFDPRFRLFKKDRAEIVVLLEINPEGANTINGQPIPRPQAIANTQPAGPAAGGYSAGKPGYQADFPPRELTQRVF